MGVTIECKKTGLSIDMGCGGFCSLRNRIAKLVGEPFASHYLKLTDSFLCGINARDDFFKNYDAKTKRLINEKKVNVKIVDFLYQSDCGGKIHYGACKKILQAIGDYDDDILYGYSGLPDCAKFKDFKAILQDCVTNKCDMVWW